MAFIHTNKLGLSHFNGTESSPFKITHQRNNPVLQWPSQRGMKSSPPCRAQVFVERLKGCCSSTASRELEQHTELWCSTWALVLCLVRFLLFPLAGSDIWQTLIAFLILWQVRSSYAFVPSHLQPWGREMWQNMDRNTHFHIHTPMQTQGCFSRNSWTLEGPANPCGSLVRYSQQRTASKQ